MEELPEEENEAPEVVKERVFRGSRSKKLRLSKQENLPGAYF
jgi:hypothetical protein